MKKTRKHFLSACIAVALAAVTAFGGFGPAIAQAAPSGEGTGTTEPIHYVALGDSMTNGYGLNGYYPNANGVTADELNTGNVWGYKRNMYVTSYPALVADHYGWELTNLAISGMRPEELRYLLEMGSENAYPGDAYTNEVFVGSWERFDSAAGRVDDNGEKRISDEYKEAIANADVISINLGTNNFGTVVTERLYALLLGEEDYRDLSAEQLLEDYPEYKEMYLELKSLALEELEKKLGAEWNTMIGMGEQMADIFAYGFIGFIINYDASVNLIRDLNPEADLIVVGLSNTLEGLELNVEGLEKPVDFGGIFNVLFRYTNIYMAALEGDGLDATFANVDDLDQLVDAIGRGEVNSVVLAKIVDSLIETAELNVDEATEKIIIQYLGGDDTVKAGIIAGIEAEALATARAALEQFNVPNVDEMDAVAVKEAAKQYANIDIDAKVAEAKTMFDMVNSIYLQIQAAAADQTIESSFAADVFTNGLNISLENLNDDLLHVWARFLLAEGVGIHPSVQGHQQYAEAIIAAYDNGYTGEDFAKAEVAEIMQEVCDFVTEYYDEAYAYAYAYADENGYIAEAIAGLDELSAELGKIDVSDLELSDELKAELENTIENAQETIAQLQTLIEEADVLDHATLDEAIDLLNKLGQNVTDIREILTQAGIEAGEAAWEAYEEAVRIFEDEIKPVIIEKLEAAVEAGTDWLIEKAGEAYDKLVEEATAAVKEYAPEVADYIYNWLYENPDKVIAFFNEYGDDMVAFVEEYSEEIAAVLGFLVAEYGDEVADYVMENADEILAALVEFYEVHGENTWALIMVYAEELGIIDALENAVDEEAICEALKAICDYITENAEAIQDAIDEAIESIKAEYEKELATIEAQLKAELEKLQTELENAAGDLKDAIENEIAKIESALEELEALKAEIESIIDEKIAELEAAIKEAEAEFNKMLEELEAEIDKVIAEGEALLAEIKAAIDEIISECEGMINDFMAGLDAEIRDAIEDAVNDAIDSADEGLDAFLAALESGLESVIDALIAEYKEAYEDATHGEYEVTNDSYYVAIGDSIIVGDNTYEEKLAEVLADDYGVKTGKNFELDGFRAEDIRALLDGTDVADVYGQSLDASVAEGIVEEIEKADIITVSLGNDNFSSFVTAQLQALIAGTPCEYDWASKVTEEGVPYVEDMLEEVYARFVAEGVSTDPATLPFLASLKVDNPAQLMTDIVEAYAYGFAGFSTNYTEVLNAIHEINPDAQVVVVGMFNPIDAAAFEDVALGEYVDYFIELSNQMFAIYAMVTPNTTFVEVPDTTTDADDVTDITEYALALAGVMPFMYSYDKYLPNANGQEYIKDQILGAMEIEKKGHINGDVNRDGQVDGRDSILLQQYLAKWDVTIDADAADVTGDGKIDGRDSILLQQYLAKWDVELK